MFARHGAAPDRGAKRDQINDFEAWLLIIDRRLTPAAALYHFLAELLEPTIVDSECHVSSRKLIVRYQQVGRLRLPLLSTFG